MQTVEKTNQLVEVVDQSGLEVQTAKSLKENFLPFFEQAEEWKKKSEELIVTDVSQVREMKMAREARLALKDIRVNADKTRKALKEDSLRYGKAVQGVYNVIEYLIVPIEKHLEEQEKFAEIQEAKQKAELKSKREMDLMPYSEFVPFGLDLENMSDEDFQKTLNGAKLQLQAKVDAEKKAEAERLENDRLDKQAQDRRVELAPYVQFMTDNHDLRSMTDNDFSTLFSSLQKAKSQYEAKQAAIAKENEQLKKDAEAKELQLAKEREEASKKLKEEQEAKAKLEAEIKAKDEAEAAAKRAAEETIAQEQKARELAEKKAKSAPDKSKLLEFAKLLQEVSLPDLKSDEANKILSDAQTLIAKTVAYITEKTETL